jgi:uncharacterized protein YndB with AHSA1/START domain
MHVYVITEIAAPAERVWQALTRTDEVRAWDGVIPFDVPDHYPEAGQYARWRSAFGPWQLILHDRIMAMEENRRFNSLIDIAFVHVDEKYVLTPSAGGCTTLVTDDDVRSKIPGLGWLAVRLTRANVNGSMSRLKDYCERVRPPGERRR